MRRDDVLGILRAHKDEMRTLGVKSIALFGSYARDAPRPDSDIDILVEFEIPVGLLGFSRLQRHLESLLDHHVDLVTRDAVRPIMRERIFQEALDV